MIECNADAKDRMTMNRKWIKRTLTASALALLSTTTVQAGWPEFMRSCSIDRQRNNAWPQPFRSMDAVSVNAPFEVMKNNGWRMFNTLGTPVFTEEQALTEAGRLQLQWIVTQAPVNRRAVFVLRGSNADDTAARIEAVQVAISDLVPTGPLPQIWVTDVEPTPSSGQYQTAISRALMNSTPKPRLPQFKGINAPSSIATSGGGGGSSGGGGGGSSNGK